METTTLSKTEIMDMVDYLNKLSDEIPRGLSRLQDALTFTILDLTAFARHGIKTKSYYKALEFAQSIPRFEDFDSDECCSWMLHDDKHLEYMP